jgi:hypothetical protein
MGILTTVVKLAAVGIAANMLLKARRDGAAGAPSTVASGSGMSGADPSRESSRTGDSHMPMPSGPGVPSGAGTSGTNGLP